MFCTVCGNEFVPLHFNQKLCSDECRKKARQIAKEKYKHTEKGLAATKRWHASERFKENEKRYRQKPVAKHKAVLRTKRYMDTHPDAVDKKRERERLYGKTKDGRFVNRLAQYKRRAIGSVDKEYLRELLAGNTCYYCGCAIDGKKTVDHKLPSSRMGTNENSNIVLSCLHCNAQKGNKTEEEYREWLHDKSNMRMRTHG